jgi:predicted O-methyltransferase YrrM
MKVFRPPDDAIDDAVKQLKKDGIIHPDARFNAEAQQGLRREVTYRDYDLQVRLSRSSKEESIVEFARMMLVSLKLIEPDARYSLKAFDSLRSDVKREFTGTWTSITPVMERLMYMLTAVRKPMRLVELGSYWGNTLAWFAGPCIGAQQEYVAESIYGVDIDVEATELARANFAKLSNCESVQLIAEDAAVALSAIDGPIDFLYLEAKDEKRVNSYLQFLKQAYDKLPRGAWVMAHDSTHFAHRDEMWPYLEWVRDKHNFSESISFEVDEFGLELSIK